MNYCYVCLGDYISPVIINTGETICCSCMRDRCPSSSTVVTNRLFNDFAAKFLRGPQLSPIPSLNAPPFNMKNMLNSSDKIAYMNQYHKIEIKKMISDLL